MRNQRIAIVLFGLAASIPVSRLGAQEAVAPGSYSLARQQLGLDVGGGLTFAFSYAHRVGQSPVYLGGRLGFAWELNQHTFEREVWEAIHGEGFARIQPTEWFQGEFGVTMAGSSPADDTNERRMFYGVFVNAMVGYRFVFIGPQLRVGSLESNWGVIYNTAIRFVLSAG